MPAVFGPWADLLLDQVPPARGSTALDLASGTGIVVRKLAPRMGAEGTIIAVELDHARIELARTLCRGLDSSVVFVEGSAENLGLAGRSVDLVYCQQGFQFFENRTRAVQEVHRVLKPGGRVAASTWMPVSRCHYFGVIHDALIKVGQQATAEVIVESFDRLSAGDLEAAFKEGGFVNVEVSRQSRSMQIEGGVEQAVEMIRGTDVGRRISGLPREVQERFRSAVVEELLTLRGCDGVTYGSLAANILTAQVG